MTRSIQTGAPGADEKMYSITELSRELGVSSRTLRFYEDKGLLSPQRVAGTRVYMTRDRARMLIILRGKRLGFTLREIADYLDLYDVDPSQKTQIDRLLLLVRDRIQLLEQQREDLEATLTELREIEQLSLSALDAGNAERPEDQQEEAKSADVVPIRRDVD